MFHITAGGPTVAILLEYDALPDIGHACGHNLIAESGVAAAIGVKQAMEQDNKIAGKVYINSHTYFMTSNSHSCWWYRI